VWVVWVKKEERNKTVPREKAIATTLTLIPWSSSLSDCGVFVALENYFQI
jgi:hypothetical protein